MQQKSRYLWIPIFPYLGLKSPYQKLQISLFEPKKISHVWNNILPNIINLIFSVIYTPSKIATPLQNK